MSSLPAYITDLGLIAQAHENREAENAAFQSFLGGHDGDMLDRLVHEINDRVSAEVDCTQCGNCCSKLIINVTQDELSSCSQHFNMTEAAFKEKYVEESMAGALFINTIPCHFFADKKCTIYEQRFKECRDFPHLHKPGFKDRFPGTVMHYGSCPIIYNVIEELKAQLGFASH